MHILAITIIATIIIGLFAVCALVWYRMLKDIDIDISDWDRHAFDDFYDEIGHITSKHN